MPIKLLDLVSIKPNITITNENTSDFKIPAALKVSLQSNLGDNYDFKDYSFSKKLNQNIALFPSQYILLTKEYKNYALNLYEYIKTYDAIKKTLLTIFNRDEKKPEDTSSIIMQSVELRENFYDDESIELFSKLFSGINDEITKASFNQKNGKYIARPSEDIFNSGILSAINTPNNNAHYFGSFIYDICGKDGLFDVICDDDIYTSVPDILASDNTQRSSIIGENRLYYGAPGTGKSYQIAQDTKGYETVRTVFHPDTQNSDFIGTLKPVNDNGTLAYRFSPGPFARALAKALQKPTEHIYLIIEELNRAPAAAVFGELFLLLDREPGGNSSYDIDFPSEEFKKWLKDEVGIPQDKLSLPANLSILTSMNSADQGVFPLDTAFRRRWISTYMPVIPSEAPEGTITVQGQKTQTNYEWKNFLEQLNDYLINKLKIEEDRLIGQRFMTNCELQDGSISGKLLIYLWDDLLRHGQRDVLFCSTHKTYGSLHRANEKTELIFSEEFLQSLSSALQDQPHETSKENAEAALEA